jgi:hypothetical protein
LLDLALLLVPRLGARTNLDRSCRDPPRLCLEALARQLQLEKPASDTGQSGNSIEPKGTFDPFVGFGSEQVKQRGRSMQTAIKTHAPEQMYVLVSLFLAIAAVAINFLGSAETAVGVALLAWVTSMLGNVVKFS